MATITAASTLAFALSPLEVALAHIAAYGFRKVELCDQVTHSRHYSVDSVDPWVVRELLAAHGLAPVAVNACLSAIPDTGQWSHGSLPVEGQSGAETEEIREAKKRLVFLKLHDPRQAAVYIDRAKRMIDHARITGIPKVCLQCGRRKQIEDLDSEMKAAAAVIDSLADYAQAHDIRILLEMPHVWDLCYDLEKAKLMLSQLQSDNIGVLVDATHWHTSGYDLDSYLRFLGERLWHVHLRDAVGRDTHTGNYNLEKTPGRGEVDFGRLGEALDKYGYRGEVTLETEYKNYCTPLTVDNENHFALAHLRKVGWEIDAAS